MKLNQLTRFGGVFSILPGIAKLISSGVYVFLASDLRAEVPAAKFLLAFAQNPTLLMAFFWNEAQLGILGVADVPALSSLVFAYSSAKLSAESMNNPAPQFAVPY